MKVIWPLSIYRYLKLIEKSDLEKKVLDCGAGGSRPPLALFHGYGYEVYGIDISELAISASEKFAREHGISLNMTEGDMRDIPFDDESFSHVFSQNSICHLTKKDTMKAIREMIRVLKPGGYLYVDFMSIESSYNANKSLGTKIGVGEYQYIDDEGDAVIHSFHNDGEPDRYFAGMKVVLRVKTISEKLNEFDTITDVRLDYYATKPI
ncbi:MAG: class I SAM-dependent methyltransferase [Candidatus Sifarchaeia archaeon]